MATNSEPYYPTLRLKGNTIRAKPSYGHTHLRDCNWIDQVGYNIGMKKYKSAYQDMTNAGYWFQSMVCNFDLNEWIQHIANIFCCTIKVCKVVVRECFSQLFEC